MMKTSDRGKELFKEWEGLRQYAYLDSGGEPTIGIGHLLTRSERRSGKILIDWMPVYYQNGLTIDQCWRLLKQDLKWFEEAVNFYVKVPLTQNQFDALVSFIFNIGASAFRDSTLLKLLNQGKYEEVPNQMRRWVLDNGKKIKGLVNRREKEIELWNSLN